MGLAASQARLLSLTARQHTVEHRAQYLQAQKLRLANDSDRVYEKYINALDATQIETRAYDKEGKVHWLEGSYNNLMRYTADDKSAGNIYYVQDINNGKLYMPQEVCKAYEGAGGDLFNFLDAMNIRYTKDVHTDEYIAAQQVVENDIKKGWNIKPYDTDFTSEYTHLKSLVSDPPESELYNAANVLFSIAAYTQNSVSGVYLPSNTSYLTELRTNINILKGTSYYNGNVQTILDYISSFDISAIFANPDSVDTLSAITQPAQDVYIYYEKDKEEAKSADEEKDVIDDTTKLKLLLNGGQYKLNGGALTDIYTAAVTNAIAGFDGATNIGDALQSIGNDIKSQETKKASEAAQADLDAFLAAKGYDQETVETNMANYKQYCDDVVTFNSQSTETHTEYKDSEKGPYYERIFYAIKSAGGCKEISDANAKSSTWVTSMIKNAQVVLATFDEDTNEIDNITASSNPGLREVSNDQEIMNADSEYEAEMAAIDSKDTKYSTELNQLEEERSAIQTEIDSLKQIAKDNIAATFKLFT